LKSGRGVFNQNPTEHESLGVHYTTKPVFNSQGVRFGDGEMIVGRAPTHYDSFSRQVSQTRQVLWLFVGISNRSPA